MRSDRSDGDSKDVLEQKLRYLEQRLLDTEECAVRTHQVDLLVTEICLLYTSPSPRDKRQSRMPSSA